MANKSILVVIKEPGKEPRVEPVFENTLKNFQKTVGGYIETVTLASDLIIVCDEEGRLKGKPHNCKVANVDFVGTVIAVGSNGDDFTSIKASNVPFVLKLLGG
jgi:hypothetical protein